MWDWLRIINQKLKDYFHGTVWQSCLRCGNDCYFLIEGVRGFGDHGCAKYNFRFKDYPIPIIRLIGEDCIFFQQKDFNQMKFLLKKWEGK